ncbi:phosphotransferase family protein [Novosphingobium sp. PS1R-30]|uniref:Phosphotransferase family protein n=1 Tax=Novosphingobium anseongense TaxID=3133436 RepID=A0ABU8RYN5_9SPHN
MSDQIVAPRTRDLSEMAEQVIPWLESKLPGATNLKIANMDYPRGAGRSHETILFDASWSAGGKDHSEGYVIRVKPDANQVYPDDLFEEQYRVMRVLHEERIVPVAETIGFEEDPALVGAPFFVMKKLTGRVAVTFPPYRETGWVAEATPAQRRRFWEGGVRNLALTQKTPLDKVQFLAGLPGQESGLTGLDQEWDKYDRFVEWISPEKRWPVLDAAREALKARWPKNQPEGLVWGDARIGNMMFDDNFDVVAVMDWEQASLGGALHDLAWWLQMSAFAHEATADKPLLDGMGTREETIALWREITGIAVDDLDWYLDFTLFKTSCLSVSTSKIWGWPEPDHAALKDRLGL